MAGKRILTTRASENMIIADDVYTSDNQMLIPKGKILTDEIIAALKEHSVFAIRVEVSEDGKTPRIAGEEEREAERQAEKVAVDVINPADETETAEPDNDSYINVRETEEFKEFKDSFMDSVDNMKEIFNSVVMKNEEVDTDALLSDVRSVAAKGRNSIHILDMLQCMRGFNDATYVHCLNVAMLSNMIGRIVYPDMPQDELDVLTLSGLLSDIGKILVPEEITMKKGRLTLPEYNIAKTHVFHGNNIIKGLNLDPRIAEVAMRHHERCDGSGYPGGYRREQTEEFARIVAIADTYDAMTSDRVYRPAICPFEVIHMFEREGIVKYDVKFLLPFLEKAAQAYINAKVKLTNGEIGKVILINKEILSRPVVKVGDKFYDLSKDNSIDIEKVLL